jgi:CRISPR-associated protein Csm4
MALVAKLRMRAPLHIGSSTLGEENTHDYVPSDTLFSALCHAYLELYGREALEALLDRFEGEPPFLISSAFPFFEDTLFLPFPRIAPVSHFGGGERGVKKRLKDVARLSLEDLSRVMRGEGPYAAEKADKLPRKELLPRVALDRESSGSSLYYARRTVFPEEGGLWVLLDARGDRALESDLAGALRLLGDMGLGGERSVGCGRFQPDFEDPPEALSRHLGGKAPYVTLSRVCPEPGTSGEVDRYALVESKGWMLSPTGAQLKRKSVWFFVEGSSFREPIRGRLVDVTPDYDPGHRVYRYGCGVYLGAA